MQLREDESTGFGTAAMAPGRLDLFAAACETFPLVQLDFESFDRHLSRLGYLHELPKHGTAVYLCAACGHGIPAALRVIEKEYFPSLTRVILRSTDDREAVDEALQRTRERLFVAPSLKISSYRGDGPLSAWLSVIAANTARDYQREQRTERRRVDAKRKCLDSPEPGATPEDTVLRRETQPVVQTALTRTLCSLRSEEQCLLRLYYVSGLNIDELGRAYGVHRSTVARRSQSCIAKIQRSVRAELQSRSVHREPQQLDGSWVCIEDAPTLSTDWLR